MKKILAGSLAALSLATAANAQAPRPAGPQGPPPREDALDPSPIDPATDPDLNMFINDWRNAKPTKLARRDTP